MKALLLSIRPKWVEKILNGEKTIEVRKKFPKEYKGWVYIYCTKDKENELLKGYKLYDREEIKYIAQGGMLTLSDFLNGKVVARFYCDKVDKWDIWQDDLEEKLKLACLSVLEFDKYSKGQIAYAIHISQLEIFDKPKELSEFNRCHLLKPLTKAPQSYQWIEVEE